MAERGNFKFTVKESASGPWIRAEPYEELAILRGGTLGFELRMNTTGDEAAQIAKFMNEKLRCITYTP